MSEGILANSDLDAELSWIHHRHVAQGRVAEAVELVEEGIKLLVENNYSHEAAKLGKLLFDTLQKGSVEWTAERTRR